MKIFNAVQGQTIGSGTIMNVGDDATGDMYYTDANGNLALLPAPPVEGDYVLHHNGTVPVWQEVAAMGALLVESEDGTVQGDTLITVTPGTGTLLYKLGSAAETVYYNQVITGWTAITPPDDITATTGQIITVVEVDDENRAFAIGSATVDSNDVAGTITVTSIAGTEVGDTNVTADPATGTLVYKIAATAQTPNTWDVLDDTWLEFTSGEDYTATTGDFITVCEVNENDEMIAIGSAEIVSNEA